MTLQLDLELPRRAPGAWLDCSDKNLTFVGCDVCGWEQRGVYLEVREVWMNHTHDPIWDIRWRANRGVAELDDVRWLLSLVEKDS